MMLSKDVCLLSALRNPAGIYLRVGLTYLPPHPPRRCCRQLTPEQKVLVEERGSVVLIGRSGTGKVGSSWP
jgi:hypothetical protein